MSFTGEINQKLAGNFSHRSIVFNKLKLLSLTPSQAVVTDANKNLVSLAYTNLNTASTLVQRDASGNFSAGTITATIAGHASLDLLASNNLSDLTSTSTARSNLGLVIGTNVEAWSATLDAVAAGTYTGSTSITTLGTISTGVWSGTAIGVTKGGTGLTSTTVNQILYSSATNTISGITVVNSAALLTGATGIPGWVAYTGSGAPVLATSPTLVTPLLGTPTSGVLTNCTGLPISTGVSGLGTGIATFLATPTSANLLSAMTTSTGTGNLVFATSPTLVTPLLGTPTSGVLTNCIGLPLTTGVTGILPVANGGSGTATPALVQGTNISITGSWPNQTINVVNNPTFSGLVTASAGIKCASTLDMNSQIADNTLLLYNGGALFSDYGIGIATGQIVHSCATGASIGHAFYAGGSSSTRLFQIAPSGAVTTKNNTLDDSSGNASFVGTSVKIVNAGEPVLVCGTALSTGNSGIFKWKSTGTLRLLIDTWASAAPIYIGGSKVVLGINEFNVKKEVQTGFNTLDDGATGAASFAGPVTLPGNATSGLQAVPLQQLTNNGPSVNITQHTYAGGF